MTKRPLLLALVPLSLVLSTCLLLASTGAGKAPVKAKKAHAAVKKTHAKPAPAKAPPVPAPAAPAPDEAAKSPAAPPAPAPDTAVQTAALVTAGKLVYDNNGCARCHGGGRAPDLSHEGARHTAEQLASYVKNPQQWDPGSRMPAYGDKISDTDLKALGVYLASRK